MKQFNILANFEEPVFILAKTPELAGKEFERLYPDATFIRILDITDVPNVDDPLGR